jgi:hypothetical protein
MPTAPTAKRFNFDRDLGSFTARQLEVIEAFKAGRRYVLYGGALGGGKSHLLRWYGPRYLMEVFKRYGIRGVKAGLFCEDYPSLKDRQLQRIEQDFPAWMGKFYSDHRTYGCAFVLAPAYGGGVISFRNLDDPSKYQSAEFALVMVDELTKNAIEVFTHLRSRLRWPGIPDHATQFLAATNPGGKGHAWVKQLWMDQLFGPEWIEPVDVRPLFHYIPSKADDNPHLDASYWATLATLPLELREAFRDGNWDVFVGQAFTEFSRERHVIDPLPIPREAPLYMTMDWGFGKPFSIGWWWVDGEDRVFRFNEWYGWNHTADKGLRLPDSEIAIGIHAKELEMGIAGRTITRLAGPDCFQKRPNYLGGGQGPSTAEVFADANIYLRGGDPTRTLKLRAFRERLKRPKEAGVMPQLVVYRCCEQFIRTIPNLVMDEQTLEDIDTKGEDHIYDECCHIVMARLGRLGSAGGGGDDLAEKGAV